MRAWVVDQPGPVASGPLRLVDRPVPEPGPGELLVRVICCGVCRTDLHLAEGDLAPRAPRITPGHEVVGEVTATGSGAARFRTGDRVGVAWLAGTDGTCRYCRRGAENLCPASTYTGWDRHGGYAEYLTVADAFAHPLPGGFSDAELAPLLCAGIIGYRALRRAQVPPGGTLGIWGFGGSAHLAAQIAMGQGAEVHVEHEPQRIQRQPLRPGRRADLHHVALGGPVGRGDRAAAHDQGAHLGQRHAERLDQVPERRRPVARNPHARLPVARCEKEPEVLVIAQADSGLAHPLSIAPRCHGYAR